MNYFKKFIIVIFYLLPDDECEEDPEEEGEEEPEDDPDEYELLEPDDPLPDEDLLYDEPDE
jgi:hypothetical protein